MDEVVVDNEPFFMDDEPEYDVFEFDMCSVDFITDVVSTYDAFAISFDLNHLPDSLE